MEEGTSKEEEQQVFENRKRKRNKGSDGSLQGLYDIAKKSVE